MGFDGVAAPVPSAEAKLNGIVPSAEKVNLPGFGAEITRSLFELIENAVLVFVGFAVGMNRKFAAAGPVNRVVGGLIPALTPVMSAKPVPFGAVL